MKAELLPLKGKYYGTIVEITDEETGYQEEVRVWYMGNYKPSHRELDDWAKSWSGRDGDPWEACDSHFESEQGLEIAERLVKAINEP